MLRSLARVAVGWLLAVLLTTFVATIVQTQFNLWFLQQIGVSVPFGVRLQATGADLLGFGPTFAPIAAVGFLIAFAVAAGLQRLLPPRPWFWYPLSGAAAIVAAMCLMKFSFDLTPVAAARIAPGMAALAAAGAIGGALFVRLAIRTDSSAGDSAQS